MMQAPFATTNDIIVAYMGFSFEIAQEGLNKFDFKVPYDCFINGAEMFFQASAMEKLNLSVVDKDNVLPMGQGQGVEVVLRKFTDDLYMDWGAVKQGPYAHPYVAKVLKDLYFRLEITAKLESIGKVGAINFYGHKLTVQG